jgi:error-prone DNA polymerase
VIIRQRPGTARGMCFMTLEDESGLCNIVVTPDLFQRHRRTIVTSPRLIVSGRLERRDGVTNVRGLAFEALALEGTEQEPATARRTPPSRDFR